MAQAFPLPSLPADTHFQPTSHGGIIRGASTLDPVTDFATSLARTLTLSPPRIDSRFLYDRKGSLLYERICRQPEYYLTRLESSILEAEADAISTLTGPVTLVELGSGSSDKNLHLLGAHRRRFDSINYVPVDVSEIALVRNAASITGSFPTARVISIHGTYADAFPLIGSFSPAMVLFLGSTIGNLGETDLAQFLESLAGSLNLGDYFLVGVDLVKDPGILEAAYNDKAGVTAAFTKNLFERMNRDLGCAINTGFIEHEAYYDGCKKQIEINARFLATQEVLFSSLPEPLLFHAGDRIRTEISRKFHVMEFLSFLESYGLQIRRVCSDANRWFALLLLQKVTNHQFNVLH